MKTTGETVNVRTRAEPLVLDEVAETDSGLPFPRPSLRDGVYKAVGFAIVHNQS